MLSFLFQKIGCIHSQHLKICKPSRGWCRCVTCDLHKMSRYRDENRCWFLSGARGCTRLSNQSTEEEEGQLLRTRSVPFVSSVLHHSFLEQWIGDYRAFPIPRDTQPLSKYTLTKAQVNDSGVMISKKTIMSWDREKWSWWPVLALNLWHLQEASWS